MKKHAWKVVAVILMLTGIFIYVYTLDETVRPVPEAGSSTASQPTTLLPPGDAPVTDKPH